MSCIADTRDSLSQSPWFFMCFTPGITTLVAVAAIINDELRHPRLPFVMMVVITGLTLAAIGMGLDVTRELDKDPTDP